MIDPAELALISGSDVPAYERDPKRYAIRKAFALGAVVEEPSPFAQTEERPLPSDCQFQHSFADLLRHWEPSTVTH